MSQTISREKMKATINEWLQKAHKLVDNEHPYYMMIGLLFYSAEWTDFEDIIILLPNSSQPNFITN